MSGILLRYLAIRRLCLKKPLSGPPFWNKRDLAYKWTLVVAAATSGLLAQALSLPTVHLDAPKATSVDAVKEPTTGIEFPRTLTIPSRFPLPEYNLLGVGVRKVSFLGINVYSVAFYADLHSVPPISRSASFEEKIHHVVKNTSCVMRIIPTRSTSYGHLRDGFMRTLQARLALQKSRNQLSAEEESRVVSPLLKFKSIFPTVPLTKHTPLDILLVPPSKQAKGTENEERKLIIRDLGSVSNTWVSQEFMLAYFEGDGISPALKSTVEKSLNDFGS